MFLTCPYIEQAFLNLFTAQLTPATSPLISDEDCRTFASDEQRSELCARRLSAE